MDAFDALLRETMLVAAMLCIPVVGVAAITGTIVAIVQAATQVQEQTLTLLPKAIAVGVLVAMFGRFGMQACAELFHHAIAAIPSLLE
jgi:flagellar biosynthetic protein FliQ